MNTPAMIAASMRYSIQQMTLVEFDRQRPQIATRAPTPMIAIPTAKKAVKYPLTNCLIAEL